MMGRPLVVAGRGRQHDHPTTSVHLAVGQPAVRSDHADSFLEPEGPGQPVQGGPSVLVGEHRNDIWVLFSHSTYRLFAANATRPPQPTQTDRSTSKAPRSECAIVRSTAGTAAQ